MARSPEEVAAARALELISLVAVPLVAEGRSLGVMRWRSTGAGARSPPPTSSWPSSWACRSR